MVTPVDPQLYAYAKALVYNKMPQHSAYRSGHVVKTYKKMFLETYGSDIPPYTGKRQKNQGLQRWFDEEWTNQRGQVGYKYKSDVYRPNIRISRETPTTFSELTDFQVKRARKEKAKTGRVKRF